MHVPTKLSDMRLRKEAHGEGGEQKADTSLGKGARGKPEIQKRKAQSCREALRETRDITRKDR